MSSNWTELFRGKASVYALDETTKQWKDRGTSGTFLMFQNNKFHADIRIKWTKNSNDLWWRLMNGKLKPKGERAWVLKAWDISTDQQEVLAVRFSDNNKSQSFVRKYNTLFPSNANLSGTAWECAVCTFKNKPTALACSTCGLSIDASMNVHKQKTIRNTNINNDLKEWGCASCTFMNPPQTLACGVCGSQKPISNAPLITSNVNQHQQQQQQQPPVYQQQQPPPAYQPMLTSPMSSMSSMSVPSNNPHMPQLIKSGSSNASNSLYNIAAAAPAAAAAMNGNNTTWICPICTLHNDVKSGRCDACHTSRVMSPPNTSTNPVIMGMSPIMNPMMNMRMPINMNMARNYGPINPMNANSNMSQMSPISQINPLNPMGVAAPMRNSMNSIGMRKNMANNVNMPMSGMMNPSDMLNNINNMQKMLINNGGISSSSSNLNNKNNQTFDDFQRAASDIACYNDDPTGVFSTLKSVAKKLLKDDIRYRTLDTTNPKVMERLIGFEGVLEFLMLLGFESDQMGMKLICEQKPSQILVRNAIRVLNGYEKKLGISKNIRNIDQKQQKQDDDNDDNDAVHVTAGGNQLLIDNNNPNDLKIDVNNPHKKEEDTLTLEQIILWSTHENMRDNDTMETLIITHKTITDSLTFIRQLRRRFFVPIPNNIRHSPKKVTNFRLTVQKRIQLKVIKSLRDWMKKYWEDDFRDDPNVCKEVLLWIDDLKKQSLVNDDSKWIAAVADTVSNEFRRYKLKGSNYFNDLIGAAGSPINLDDVSIPLNYSLSLQSASTIANQITLMDYRRFCKIQGRECIGQAWKKKNNIDIAPNILSMIQHFNNLTLFIQIRILRETSLRSRSKSIRRVILIGERFRILRNYNSLCAIFSALNSAPIHRLKLAWKRVAQKYLNMFENFRIIFSREFNHRNLRQLFRHSPAPSIPHLGLFLQDLVFIDDGNSTKIEIDNFKQHGPMANFNKCVRTTDRIKNIRLYQSHPYKNLKNNLILQKILLCEFHKLKDITEDQVWDMSDEIKKMDEKDSKKSWIQ